jgi:SAM-dependent methyltransferase
VNNATMTDREAAHPAANPLNTARIGNQRLGARPRGLGVLTTALLDRVKLGAGARAIDLGCGGGEALELPSNRVRVAGRVLGVDIEPATVATARVLADEQRIANVEIMTGDARATGLTTGSFDLVHTRLLRVTVASPQRVIAETARLLRPGGWVAVLEPDIGLRACRPSHPSVERLTELVGAACQLTGADVYVARRLPHLLARAGLVEIAAEARAEVSPPGTGSGP